MVCGASNVDCKAIQVNGNNVTRATNAKHLGNVVDHKLSDLNDINAKKGYFIVLTGLWATSEAKCLLIVIFVYFSLIVAPIMAQLYGHYMIKVQRFLRHLEQRRQAHLKRQLYDAYSTFRTIN